MENEKIKKTISDLAHGLEKELSAKDSELKAFREELQKVSEELKNSRQHGNELQAKIGPFAAENTALITELEEIKTFLKRELDEKNQIVETTKLASQREIDKMKDFLENERKSLEENIREKDGEITMLRNEIKLKDENAHKQIAASNQKVIRIEKKFTEERTLWKSLKDEYQAKLNELEKNKKEVADYMLNDLEGLLTKERLYWREQLYKKQEKSNI